MTTMQRTRKGVTILEALMAMTILAAAMSIMVPSLLGARRASERVACMNALAEIAKGAVIYSKNFDDWIIGSPAGSGAYLQGQSQAWGPAIQTWDFMGPMEALWDMGITQPSKGDTRGVALRFNSLRSSGAFLCPGNEFLAPSYSGGTIDAGVGPMVSYNTQRLQLSVASEISPGTRVWAGGSGIGTGYLAPSGWKPMLGRIGSAAKKIFCGDGARYSSCSAAPDYDLTTSPMTGYDCDGGSLSAWSRSWDRCRAPGNSAAPGGLIPTAIDPRCYAYRHSQGEPPAGAPANAFKANFAFYDGHVETQGDLESSNPHQWLPSGSVVEDAASEIWPDTAAFYGAGPIDIGG